MSHGYEGYGYTNVFSGSFGTSMLDKSPTRVTASWSELCDLWEAWAQEPRHPDAKSGVPMVDEYGERKGWKVKPSTPFFSPFLMRDGAVGKTKENVEGCGAWFGCDVDRGWTLDRLAARFASPKFVHTTTSNYTHDPHLRSIVPLSRNLVDEIEYQAVWWFFNDLLDGALDPSTKNINRLLYVPAAWEGRDNEYRVQREGCGWHVEFLLYMAKDRVATIVGEPEGVERLDGNPISGDLLTPKILSQFQSEPVGGRMWRLMLRIATRARYLGWELNAAQLVAAAKQADGKVRTGLSREAERVLARAATFDITPRLEKTPQADHEKLKAAMRRLRFTRKT